MNLLRKFIRASPTDEVASIAFGKFFLTRSLSSPKGALECLYNDSSLTIKQTTKPFCYQLSVTRAYQEGECSSQSTDEEEEEDDAQSASKDFSSSDERSFFINQDLNAMLYSKNDGTQAISWRDINGDEGERLEFVVDEDVRANEATKFMLTLFRCLYEDKYAKSSAGVPEEELKDEFAINIKWDSPAASTPMSLLKNIDALSSNLRKVSLDGRRPKTPPGSDTSSEDAFKDASSIPYHILKSNVPLTGQKIYNFAAQLRVYDRGTDQFCMLVPQSEFSIVKTGPKSYSLTSSSSENGLSVPISKTISPSFRKDALSFIFTYSVQDAEDTSDYSLLLHFATLENLEQFEIEFSKVLGETNEKGRLASKHER